MKTSYTAIVVEDERLPRLSLIQKITLYHPDIKIVADCDDCDSAMEAILRLNPDILFLDIQLKGKTSMELLTDLKAIRPLPYVIFTTAYSQTEYLMQAIKFAAADYLMKPISVVDLAQAIQRIREREQGTPTESNKVTLKTLTGTLFVTFDEILYVKAYGNYAQVQLDDKEEVVFERLGELEARLPSSHFCRISRSLLLNKELIYKVDKKNKRCTLRSRNGKLYELDLPASCQMML